MICHDHRCIFVHVPKTAGQSMEHVFIDRAGLTWETRSPLLLRPNDDPAKGPPHLAHLTAADYTRHSYATEEQFGSYFKFAFVRNPWTRTVSEYKFRRYPQRFSFKHYLFEHLPEPVGSKAHTHTMPQWDYLHSDEGELLVDFVGRFERLQDDFNEVCDRLGIEQTPLPHTNKSLDKSKFKKRRSLNLFKRIDHQLRKRREQRNTRPRWQDYYDDETREFVAELYKKDIETFGYAFDS